MRTRKALLFILLSIIGARNISAQKLFQIEVVIPDSAMAKHASIHFDNGRSTISKKVSFTNGHSLLTDTFYSQKAVIFIAITNSNNNYSNAYFVDQQPASFSFVRIDTPAGRPVFETVNAYSLSEMGEKQQRAFTAEKEMQLNNFLQVNGAKMSQGDSATAVEFNKRVLAITNKRLEFIATNKDLYYSLWFFKNNIIGNLLVAPDSLLAFFDKTFSEPIRQSDEGQQIVTFLYGRKLSSVKKSKAPDFSTVDLDGKRISLTDYKGKYVLLSFWATWCVPCVAELPAMREIRKQTSTDKLAFISISFDSDKKTLQKGIQTHEMNWTNVFYDENISKMYGVSSLPQLYLIDDKGRIVYSRKTDETGYTNLDKLRKVISVANLQ